MTNQWAEFILMMFYLLHVFKQQKKQSSSLFMQSLVHVKKATLVKYNGDSK